MSDYNPNCDGAWCAGSKEVRVYPIGAGGNLILCRRCFAHENVFNAQRGFRNPNAWPIVNWSTAKPYPEES